MRQEAFLGGVAAFINTVQKNSIIYGKCDPPPKPLHMAEQFHNVMYLAGFLAFFHDQGFQTRFHTLLAVIAHGLVLAVIQKYLCGSKLIAREPNRMIPPGSYNVMIRSRISSSVFNMIVKFRGKDRAGQAFVFARINDAMKQKEMVAVQGLEPRTQEL